MRDPVAVVGGGAAGCEAAWQLARRGVPVRLYEMRPRRLTPAHTTDRLAEITGSASLRSDDLSNISGLLHEEMRRAGSLLLEVADESSVPAGRMLAVDRVSFSETVTERIRAEPRIELVREEVTGIPEEPAILAPGPYPSAALAEALLGTCGPLRYFYDATSPILVADSLDPKCIFRASPRGENEGETLNIPVSRERYLAFVEEVRRAETAPLPRLEPVTYAPGGIPIEVVVRRGVNALASGPMKTRGLPSDPGSETPFAVVELRPEDRAGTLYGLVGLDTRMRVAEQRRVFRMLPGMERAIFARFGSVTRKTFVSSPEVLSPHLAHRQRPGLYLAGHTTGVEGIVESAATGLLAGLHLAHQVRGRVAPLPPTTTAMGSLLRALVQPSPRPSRPSRPSGPIHLNFGLLPPLEQRGPGLTRRERNLRVSERALSDLEGYLNALGSGCA